MPVNRDFRDLFAELNSARARYLVVGAHAVAFYCQPRFTKDLDVWVEATAENARAVFSALKAFGAPVGDLSVADLAKPGLIFQIGVAPNRIDIVTSIDGVIFSDAWKGKQDTSYGDQRIQVIGRNHLIVNKRAVGRPQDLLDVDMLEKSTLE